MKIITNIIIGIMFLFPIYGHGSVVFSEIMYDLEGSDTNEWVEVQNIGTKLDTEK